MTCKKMAQILGSMRSFLMALPWLRSFTDQRNQFGNGHRKFGWDTPLLIPEIVREQVATFKSSLQEWRGRPFLTTPTRELHSDSSTFGWGGTDLSTGYSIQDFWRTRTNEHINLKKTTGRHGHNPKFFERKIIHKNLRRQWGHLSLLKKSLGGGSPITIN